MKAGPSRKKRRDQHAGDRLFRRFMQSCAVLIVMLLAAIALFLAKGAAPALSHFGASFFSTTTWDPVRDLFGALPVIYGTLVSALGALLLASPLGIAVALFLQELAPRRLADLISFFIEMLASIPSVVYGLWGIFILAPLLRTHVEPFLFEYLGFIPLFNGPFYGIGMLAAIIVLTIMILPTITSISREVFRTVPEHQKEAVLALGGTRWEMIKVAVLASSKKGLFGAMTLGLGRAIGETMAVTMVIGNRSEISLSLFDPSQTMASIIANEYTEATSEMHLAALTAVGLTLLVITLVVNMLARFIVWSSEKKWR